MQCILEKKRIKTFLNTELLLILLSQFFIFLLSSFLVDAVKQGKLSEILVRERVKPLFYTRMRLGEFDPPEMNPYLQYNLSVVQSPEHRQLAVKAAMQSFVLLKNDNNLLPIKKHFKRIAVSVFLGFN
jgi:beta-glucosidase-like glycosyl hydrolase